MSDSVGLVLSGGGARGAYEVGILQGIVEVLDRGESDDSPFDIVSGTSVGAINAVWVGAWGHRGDVNIRGLRQRWDDLRLETHLNFDLQGAASILGGERIRRLLTESLHSEHVSFLKADPFEHLVEHEIPWSQLHRNVSSGVMEAVAVAALEVSSGKTIVFGELGEGIELERVEDPRRQFRPTSVHSDHVLASAAIPLIFPAREIDLELYCDGGLRLNTPIPPAIRAGADRLVVVSVGEVGEFSAGEGEWARAARRANFPNPIFLAGKALNALLVDPVYQEVQLTNRINRMVKAMEDVLDDEQMAEVERAVTEERGAPYRHVPTLSFRPSENVSELARDYLQTVEPRRFATRRLVDFAGSGSTVERDLLSFILFDGDFAEELILLGRRDALARGEEIRAFFEGEDDE